MAIPALAGLLVFLFSLLFIIMLPTVGKGAISVAFVRPSVRLSACLFVYLSVRRERIIREPKGLIAQIWNAGFPPACDICLKCAVYKSTYLLTYLLTYHRCDSHTTFKVKRSKVRVTDGRGHTVSAEPSSHTACLREL